MSAPSAAVYDTCPWFLLAVIAVFVVAELGAAAFDLPAPHDAVSLVSVGLGGGLVGYLFAWISRAKTTWDWICCLSAGLILPLGNAIMPAALAETSFILPKVFDDNVVRLDAAFGLQASFALAHVLADHATVKWICGIVYALVLLPPALLALMEGRSGRRTGIGALPTFLAIAGAGFSIYHALPVIGPRAWFGDAFPLHSVRHDLIEPRNAMPSLHTAWVLMAFLCARGMRVTRLVIGVWLVLMLVATLGLGEHYLVDLICAVPFVLLLRAVCASDVPWSARARWRGVIAGGSIFLVWGLAVRGVIRPSGFPGAVPALAACTVILSAIWEQRLARAQGILPAPAGFREPRLT